MTISFVPTMVIAFSTRRIWGRSLPFTVFCPTHTLCICAKYVYILKGFVANSPVALNARTNVCWQLSRQFSIVPTSKVIVGRVLVQEKVRAVR